VQLGLGGQRADPRAVFGHHAPKRVVGQMITPYNSIACWRLLGRHAQNRTGRDADDHRLVNSIYRSESAILKLSAFPPRPGVCAVRSEEKNAAAPQARCSSVSRSTESRGATSVRPPNRMAL